MRIALDGRPLRHPYTGIGVYLQEILSRIADEHELFVYLDRPLPSPPAFRATLRSGRWSGAAAQAAALVRRFNPRCRIHVTPLAARLAPSGEGCPQPPHPRPYLYLIRHIYTRDNFMALYWPLRKSPSSKSMSCDTELQEVCRIACIQAS